MVLLALVLGWMYVSTVAMQWWFRARTVWLTRLSARGLLTGAYTPGPANWLGGWKWNLRQRMPVSDFVKMERLEDEVDDDRVTEVWRVRTTRRFRVALATGAGGLLVLGLALSVYESLRWQLFLFVVVLTAAVAFVPGRALFRRAREWADYGADLIQ